MTAQMTSQIANCPAASSAPAHATPRRPVPLLWAQWAAVLTVMVALLGAGISVTCVPGELVIASAH